MRKDVNLAIRYSTKSLLQNTRHYSIESIKANCTTKPEASLPKDIRTLLKTAADLGPGILVKAHGWVQTVRNLKKISFIQLSDGTCEQSLSVVCNQPDLLKNVQTGTSLEISGIWQKSKGKQQEYEIQLTDLKVLGPVTLQYPLQKKSHSNEFLRSLSVLKFKSSRIGSIMRTRSFLDYKLNEFFDLQNFIKTNPPIISSSDCEGAGELFEIESASIIQGKASKNNPDAKTSPFFGKKTYLTVSTQLHLEILAQAYTNVWTMSPCFRAEPSDTTRHLSEFWMLEAEMAFVDKVDQLTLFCEKMIKFLASSISNNEKNSLNNLLLNNRRPKEELIEIENRLHTILKSPNWYQITYNDAIKLLQDSNKKWTYLAPKFGESLTTEHEKYLANVVFNNSPVFVTDYPKDEKAFYMKTNESYPETVACFDLLFPQIGELIGGSVREENYEKLLHEVKRRKMELTDLQWYLDLRKDGSVPHGGFGMGFERLISYISNVENIKDVIPLSRSIDNCSC